MLNISTNSISDKIRREDFDVLSKVESKLTGRTLFRVSIWALVLSILVALLPWTQNVRSSGKVSTLKPGQRPQTIHSIIAGRIDQWKVQEGDFIKAGDTIAIISEIKDDYFDAELLPRTLNQLELKKQTTGAYEEKIVAQGNQLLALIKQRDLNLQQAVLKLQQSRLKVENDSIEYIAAKLNSTTAEIQFARMDSLYRLGLKSLVDYESRRIAQQGTKAKEVSARNKWLNTKNDVLNLELELANIQSKFANEYAKILSERLSTNANAFDAEAYVNNLANKYRNLEVRAGFHAIRAQQDGYVTKTYVQGIGETVKEGQAIVSLMPKIYDLAVEVYVNPIDLPLMRIGSHVRIQFDGWPAIVFSGWPNASYGTFGGTVYAVDQFISENGKFRILVKPDESDHAWPEALRFGGGTKTMILLDDVPIWYELWRKVNGFPPNFYHGNGETKSDEK